MSAPGPTGSAGGVGPQDVEALLLGGPPSLTREQVAEQAGVPLELATELWRRLGFAQVDDDAVAFTDRDVEALRLARELVELGVLGEDSQTALVRTWGRSFARLAEWQTALLAHVASTDGADGDDPAARLARLTDEVLPRVETLQNYIWRRHLASASSELREVATDTGDDTAPLSVVFVDIVGYTATSKRLDSAGLVRWVEAFEDEVATAVADHADAGARVIKGIGDEVLLVADDPAAAGAIALGLVERGEDADDDFPRVRAGLAHGPVVQRLGDVFGQTVNLAARVTSAARPGTVLVDQGAHDVLCGDHGDSPAAREGRFALRRVRRASVKDYSGLRVWALRHGRGDAADGSR
ncbi:adenylate/guanylate cyclase domain-containing protein [Nocardioides sp. CFH 31398]|uniref:adenylate/guanylate cyclase domain-containing protein n=1 Tax=Nocardioides sp. CFH 31398 TaxID=2919579 RepID=UPI001F06DB54|nr:adenylate/guanylate cyclase domain-containing protein [Nocardioides sp. CFH 31398]MCH1865589.1 adenylate/guanylate cyclase domain-containing protein [Nocardioides sp. CFH 31398]